MRIRFCIINNIPTFRVQLFFHMAIDTKQVFAKAEMLIRKLVNEVFDAIINPAITTNFWLQTAAVDWMKLEYGIRLNRVADRFPR